MISKIKNKTFRKLKVQPKPTEYEKFEKTSRPLLPSSRQYSIPPSCATRLTRDMVTLVNTQQDSDVQFKVGGGGDIPTIQETGESTNDESGVVTLYAHSPILRCRSRYFAALLDEEKKLGGSSKYVINQPNVSTTTFKHILHYIYTGNVCARRFQNIIELIAAAEDMELEGLSIECQTKLLRKIKNILYDKYDGDEEGPIKQYISIDVATRTYIIPALNLASTRRLPDLSRSLLTIIIPYVPDIIESPNLYSTFIDNISSEDLVKVIESDNLAMNERSIWDLVLDWACHQIKLEKTAVEEHLCNAEYDEEDESDDDQELSDEKKINSSDLSQLKAILTPFLPAIRFSLLAPDEYAHTIHIVNYFLPRRQSVELQQHFMKADRTRQLDVPRVISKIITNFRIWNFVKKNIFETGGIIGCSTFHYLKFKLLFRASEDGFLATTFHLRCDNKGPTLVLVKSADGYLFGGVNFDHWKSDNTWSSCPLNLLFTFPDGRHRKNSNVFKLDQTSNASSGNFPTHGPVFGNNDLYIDSNYFGSHFPISFKRDAESDVVLADKKSPEISDYEVFAIS